MGKLIEGRFPVAKKEEKEKPRYGMSEQNRAIDSVSNERIMFILNLRKNNPIDRHSDIYADAFLEFQRMPIAEVAECIKNASEIEIKKKLKYFAAALDVLLKK